MPKKKKRTKKVKYYKAEFKIPESTKKRLRGFCKKHNVTENKVFRRALREFLEKNHFHQEHYDMQVAPNQMSIFDLLEDTTLKTN
ncbi:MAG: hypothetical protein HXX13_11200 [Bacteroidetes bacterium]|jgi:hypothetical protein|nr:hypothetical protein [Bacteroidota bacterium]